MRPGDGQLSLFEVDTIDQSQRTPTLPLRPPPPTGFGDAVQAEPETRAASQMPEAEAGRRPPRTRPGTDPGESASPTRAPERRPRRAPPVSESLLSPEDVARWCGLSRKAVYRAVARGELRAARILSRLRIDPSDVEAWLRASIVDPHRPAAPVPARLPSSTGLRRLLPEP